MKSLLKMIPYLKTKITLPINDKRVNYEKILGSIIYIVQLTMERMRG